MGCFYVESPAMRMLLTKLKASSYLDLVAASSIIRPGVAQSGMMQEYIRRFHMLDHGKGIAIPELWDIMKETFGVMVYQEDVIKVAYSFARFSLEEADKLRRGMGGKYRGRQEFLEVKDKFFPTAVKMAGMKS
jgi:DNA polymerase-3 subunit alpha